MSRCNIPPCGSGRRRARLPAINSTAGRAGRGLKTISAILPPRIRFIPRQTRLASCSFASWSWTTLRMAGIRPIASCFVEASVCRSFCPIPTARLTTLMATRALQPVATPDRQTLFPPLTLGKLDHENWGSRGGCSFGGASGSYTCNPRTPTYQHSCPHDARLTVWGIAFDMGFHRGDSREPLELKRQRSCRVSRVRGMGTWRTPANV